MNVFHIYFSLLSLLAPLMVVIGVGTIWGKLGHPFPAQFVTVLATTVTTPALVFYTLVTTQLSDEVMGKVAIATVLALGLCMVACAIALKLCRLPVRKLLQTTSFPNAGNLGLPITHLAFGDAGLSTSIAFFAVASFIQHTVGVRTLPSAPGIPAPWKSPILVASVLAVACRLLGFTPPQWIMDSAQLLGSMTVPLMLLGLGHALALIPPAGLSLGGIISVMRLTFGLGTGALGAWLAGLPADMIGNIALQMGMPCAVVSYMYARRYTDVGDTSAGAVLISTLVFLVLAPFLMWLLGAPVAR
ncbi:AEC family transporter [Pigmentiphaga sp.]|jgi:Predicted permeases|uniref:AEC family transporter n=1 Tax=Pigmentiphaga sp. TaxID=1977564 RepID=UPI0025F1DFA2|nr:AEC family transporter [Pigmentiphaga sp.]MBX6319065.1 AEC family transporter [Pigmentiphaga sp.]